MVGGMPDAVVFEDVSDSSLRADKGACTSTGGVADPGLELKR